MYSNQESDLTFTADELDLLGRTADALTAYMGKPVLVEVVDAEETGFEWALFAVPLGTDGEVQDDTVVVEVGGPGARILGNRGGLSFKEDDIYDCEYLWSVQLSDLEGVRYIKVDQEGDEVAWSEDLQSILPFALTDEPVPEDDDDDDELSESDEDESGTDGSDGDDDFDSPFVDPTRTLH